MPFRIFNRYFDSLTTGYTSGVGFIARRFVIGLLIFAGILAATGLMFRAIPSSLVPDEDQGFLIGATILPPAASLYRTTAAMDQSSANLQKHPAVENVFAIAGYDSTRRGSQTECGHDFRDAQGLEPSARRRNSTRAISRVPSRR